MESIEYEEHTYNAIRQIFPKFYEMARDEASKVAERAPLRLYVTTMKPLKGADLLEKYDDYWILAAMGYTPSLNKEKSAYESFKCQRKVLLVDLQSSHLPGAVISLDVGPLDEPPTSEVPASELKTTWYCFKEQNPISLVGYPINTTQTKQDQTRLSSIPSSGAIRYTYWALLSENKSIEEVCAVADLPPLDYSIIANEIHLKRIPSYARALLVKINNEQSVRPIQTHLSLSNGITEVGYLWGNVKSPMIKLATIKEGLLYPSFSGVLVDSYGNTTRFTANTALDISRGEEVFTY